MKPSTVLKKARKLIERGWCKGPYATDKDGNEVDQYSRKAVNFCAAGASDRVCGKDDDLKDECFSRLCAANAISFTHQRINKATILKRVDRAIALAEKEGR